MFPHPGRKLKRVDSAIDHGDSQFPERPVRWCHQWIERLLARGLGLQFSTESLQTKRIRRANASSVFLAFDVAQCGKCRDRFIKIRSHTFCPICLLKIMRRSSDGVTCRLRGATELLLVQGIESSELSACVFSLEVVTYGKAGFDPIGFWIAERNRGIETRIASTVVDGLQ
jgi:hypothetical protein